MNLMIVESPNKVEKIQGILGNNWVVRATAGHIRDLPRNELGIDIENAFLPHYEYTPDQEVNGRTYPGGKTRMERIRPLLAKVDMVYIATDPDREGEAIAWHIKQCLNLRDNQYQRVTFDAITEKTIKASLAKQHKINDPLVNAQEARRVLDRLVGYLVSPVISHIASENLSAGRVQSVAVRLVTDLEKRIQAFKPVDHFGATVFFDNGKWKATWDTKAGYVSDENPYILKEASARIASQCRDFTVSSCETELTRKAPPSCFSTSLMLQAASITLKFDPEKTTKLAQRLFEQGLVTYIRTDSTNIDDEAIDEIRTYATSQGWKIPAKGRKFKSKGGAQEAHEAIRPTHIDLEEGGDNEEEKHLYKLIRLRTIASQLADATYNKRIVILTHNSPEGTFVFNATGQTLVEPGWKVLTATDSAAENEDEDDKNTAGDIPNLQQGSKLAADSGEVDKKRTQAPGRYSKASLIKKLEVEGVGRPATYSAIISNIMNRAYLGIVNKDKLKPTERGVQIVEMLIKTQFSFIEIGFTKKLEEQLDNIAERKDNYLSVIEQQYKVLNHELSTIEKMMPAKAPCPKCGNNLIRYVKDGFPFWYCRNKDCKHIMDDYQNKPVERQPHNCLLCGTGLKVYRPKNKATGMFLGHIAWLCPNEECKTFYDNVDNKPTRHVCPKCKSTIHRFQKKNKEGKPLNQFSWCCSNAECKTYMDDKDGKPVPQLKFNCPKCKSLMFRYQKKKDGKLTRAFGWCCSSRSCKTFMDDKAGRPVPQQPKKK